MATVLGMFPLETVLLPGGVLPLHVFEPRYRRLVQDALAAPGVPEFGQTLITRGAEVGGGDQRATVGTRAQMHRIEALDQGRYTFVAVGIGRIRVLEWLDDDPYPRALVEEWPDEPAAMDEPLRIRLRAAIERTERVCALAGTLGDATIADLVPLKDATAATYRLATLAPLGPADRYRLLTASGPIERLDLLTDALDDAEAVARFQRGEP